MYRVSRVQCLNRAQIALPVDETRDPQLSKPGTDLEYQFHTSKFVYFKNPRCRELDEYLGCGGRISLALTALHSDIHYVIVELESAIIRELEQHVLQHSGLLLQLATLLAELDWCVLGHLLRRNSSIVSSALPRLRAFPSGRVPSSRRKRNSTSPAVAILCRSSACPHVRTSSWRTTPLCLTHSSHSEQHVDVDGPRGYAEAHLGPQRLRQERVRQASGSDRSDGAHW